MLVWVLFLTWLVPGYSWERELIVPGLVNTSEITIKDMDFRKEGIGSVSNQSLTIPIGMKVSWVNRDPSITVEGDEGLVPHRIKIADSMENVFTVSSILTEEHNTFSYTFSREGTYQYGCMIHPFMKGTINVVNRGT